MKMTHEQQMAKAQKARQELESKMENADWCWMFMNRIVDGICDSYELMADTRVPDIIRTVLRSDDARRVFEALCYGTLTEYIRETDQHYVLTEGETK